MSKVMASVSGRTIRLKASRPPPSQHVQRDAAAPGGEGGEEDQAVLPPEGAQAPALGPSYTKKPPAPAPAGGGEGGGPLVATSSAGAGAHVQRDGAMPIGDYLSGSSGRGGGLPSQVSREMSGMFGHDFSGVSVHNDSAAHNVCRSIGANAFATGNDVYFAAGKFAPGSREGDQLIAHELTHVVQQNGGGVSRRLAKKGVSFSSPGDPYETQADAVAESVIAMKYGGAGSRLGKVDSGSGGESQVARDASGAMPSTSLASAIISRKIAGVPDVQMDIGITLGIAGLVVGVVGVGVSLAAFGGNKLTKEVKELVAQPSVDRDRYREANPWRRKTWTPMPLNRGGSLAGRFWYGLQLSWDHNGQEISNVSVGFAPGTENPTFGSSEAEFTITDNVGTQANPALGYSYSVDYDPMGGGHYIFSGNGRFGADGSGRGSNNWRAA
jgi:hypothetical protein